MRKSESEFGKGFVYTLTLFAMHFERDIGKIRGIKTDLDEKIIAEVYKGNEEKWL